MSKKLLTGLLLSVSLLAGSISVVYAESADAAATQVVREDWNEEVKTAVNEFIELYADTEAAYVVTDFDNTCSIFDVEEQLAVHQLLRMAFACTPEELPEILATGLSDLDAPREGYALDEQTHSYNDWISDISAAYAKIYESYGPFTAAGISDEAVLAEIQQDPQWIEFATKMRAMYDLVYDNESAAVAYPWVLYWFTGFSEEEVYQLALGSHNTYKEVETSTVEWISPEDLESVVGQVSYEWTSGVQVSENIKEMFQAMDAAGIDVWVCSASCTSAIRAAVDAWDMHDYISGVLAMTNKLDENGIYINEYDYDTGYAWYTDGDGWVKGDVATGAQTQGAGKVTAIDNVLVASYGCGPLAGFMDSTGDFDFCTVYDSLKLVICFNRASRKVTDGGGVIAELAVYQKDTLGYDLKSANEAGDTYYVLQGREENGLRSLRNARTTLTYGSTEEKLFRNEDNEAQLQYMIDHAMTTEEVINTFAPKTAADDEGNVLGFKYGFHSDYAGYHTNTGK